MSYSLTCYFDDEDIEYTKITIYPTGTEYVRYYGDETLIVSGLNEQLTLEFEAVAKNGCEFTRWVMRMGSTTAPVLYSESSTFTYSGTQNIYIRAEGTETGSGTGETWTLKSEAFGELDYEETRAVEISEHQMYRFSVSFKYSGTATFATTGALDTHGYLSTDTGWDRTSGAPTDILIEDDDSGSRYNFQFTQHVTSGTVYYIWVRCYDEWDSGSTELVITPPEQGVIDKWSWTSSNGQATAVETRQANTAITSNGETLSFNHLVWNDMVDKVKEIYDFTGYDWDNSYATYSDTKMTESDTTLTAERFNSLRYNIGIWCSTGITERVRGNTVYGDYLTTLAECLNGWIDLL